jgi:hypothetical protein
MMEFFTFKMCIVKCFNYNQYYQSGGDDNHQIFLTQAGSAAPAAGPPRRPGPRPPSAGRPVPRHRSGDSDPALKLPSPGPVPGASDRDCRRESCGRSCVSRSRRESPLESGLDSADSELRVPGTWATAGPGQGQLQHCQ